MPAPQRQGIDTREAVDDRVRQMLRLDAWLRDNRATLVRMLFARTPRV